MIRDKNFPHNPVDAIRNGFAEAERKFTELAQHSDGELDRSGSCAIVTLIVGKSNLRISQKIR